MKPSSSSSSEIKIVATKELLESIRYETPFKRAPAVPIENAISILEGMVGDKVQRAKDNLDAVKDRARYHFITAPGDEFLLERSILMGISDVANQGGLKLFTISFPHIDLFVVDKKSPDIPS